MLADVVLENLSTCNSKTILTRLANPDRARWQLRFSLTSWSSLNPVEGWLSELTSRLHKKRTTSSVDQLDEAIELCSENWNDGPTRFTRGTCPSEEMIDKVEWRRTG